MALRAITDSVHVHETGQRFFGLEVGARMTLLSLEGGLLLHSPTACPPEEVARLGSARWILSPNKLHHLYAGPWMARGAEGWCARGLETKRSDLPWTGTVAEECRPFGDEVLLVPLRCFPFSNEVVLFHAPSRTLVVTDLVFHFGPDAPLLTKAAMCAAGGYPGCRTTGLERVGMNRAVARSEIRRLLELDFDRLIPSHGHIVETGGKQALRGAFDWLGIAP